MSGVIVNKARIDAIIHDPDGPVAETFRSLVRCVEATAKTNAKVDTGVLRSSITSEVTVSRSEIKGVIRADAPYAGYVEGGTGVYGPSGQPIRPKRGKYLVFPNKEGGTTFVQEVQGSKAVPFMAPALETCLSKMRHR